MIRDTLVIALEASWEQDPVMLDDILWKSIDFNSKLCYDSPDDRKKKSKKSRTKIL